MWCECGVVVVWCECGVVGVRVCTAQLNTHRTHMFVKHICLYMYLHWKKLTPNSEVDSVWTMF